MKAHVNYVNKDKMVAILSIQGNETSAGLIPEKSGLIRIGESFKGEAGEDIDLGNDIKYSDVGTRTSITDSGVLTWLVL